MTHPRLDSIVALGLLPVAALLVAGCSSGSGGSSYGPSTTAATTVAGVSTADVQRDPVGYDWGQAAVSSAAQASVPALGVAGVGTDAVAALGPQAEVFELAAGTRTALPFVGRQFLTSGGQTFLATGGAPGAGDVYVQTPTGWRELLAGDQDQAVLAEHAGRLLAFTGSATGEASAYRYDAAGGTWDQLTGLGGYVPSAAATVFGEVWLGAGPVGTSGAATLLRGGWMGLAPVALAGLADVAGQRQRVTALQAVPRGVVVALGAFDATTDAPLGGEVVLLVPGEAERLLGQYAGEAPLALAFQDETVYVGTSAGRLQFLDGQGRLIDESLPAGVEAVESLASPDRLTLLVGCRATQGALILTRTARSLTPTSTGGAGGAAGPGWADVKAAMVSCAGCHSTMTTGWTVSAGLADDQGDYQATLAEIDLAAPASSLLLQKGSAAVAHAGGGLWPATGAEYQLVQTWIEGGAPFDAPVGSTGTTTGGATPGTPTTPTTPATPNTSNPDYVNDMQALLQSCVGCHASMNTGYLLSAGLANPMADFQATLGEVDLNNPGGSLLLTKTSGGVAHAGGAAWPMGSAAYQTTLAWIQGGAPYQIAGRTPTTPTIPTMPKYVTDIKPIVISCATCHNGSRTDDMRLSTGLVDDARDYRSLLGEVNLTDPTRSSLLRVPSRGGEHPKLFDVGSVPYETLLKWIQTGAAFN